VVCSQRRDALLSPPVSPAGFQAVAIEISGDLPVPTDSRESSHGLDHVGVGARGRTALAAWDPQFRMNPTFPVNDQNDFAGLIIDVRDDFVNERANDAFLQSSI